MSSLIATLGQSWLPLKQVLNRKWGQVRDSHKDKKIERAKMLDFSDTKVALAIAVRPDPENEGETEIVVQVYPTGEESLPVGLKLRVELESDSDEEVAREGAKFVRLAFSELLGKTFRVQISLADTVITEQFVV